MSLAEFMRIAHRTARFRIENESPLSEDEVEIIISNELYTQYERLRKNLIQIIEGLEEIVPIHLTIVFGDNRLRQVYNLKYGCEPIRRFFKAKGVDVSIESYERIGYRPLDELQLAPVYKCKFVF